MKHDGPFASICAILGGGYGSIRLSLLDINFLDPVWLVKLTWSLIIAFLSAIAGLAAKHCWHWAVRKIGKYFKK